MTGKIGSWWLAGVNALPGEEVLWSVGANRTQSADRAVGGILFVTNQRLVFCPHLLDFVLAGEIWMADHERVQAVEKKAKGDDFYGGGLRDRLLIRQQDGRVDLFVVNRLDQVIERLRADLH